MKKKLYTTFILLLSIVFCFVPIANATTTRASYYLNAYSIDISRDSTNTVYVEVTVYGTGIMDDIGAKTITVYEREPDATSWNPVKTFSYTSYSKMMEHDESYHYFYVSYAGKAEYSYKAVAYVYAGKDGDGDTRTMMSAVV